MIKITKEKIKKPDNREEFLLKYLGYTTILIHAIELANNKIEFCPICKSEKPFHHEDICEMGTVVQLAKDMADLIKEK